MPTAALLPVTPVHRAHETEACVAVLEECRSECRRCADAWLLSSPLGSEALRCIRLLLDCADLCESAADLLPYVDEANPVVLRSQLGACAVACDRAIRETERLRGRNAFTVSCLSTCRRAAQSCRSTIPLLPTAAAAAA